MGALVALTIGLTGCGKSEPRGPSFGSEDGKQIAVLLEDLTEAAADTPKASALFAGQPPANLKQFGRYRFEVKANPTVSGDTATATVQIVAENDGTEKGATEWSFVKEGGKWKVKTAPLP